MDIDLLVKLTARAWSLEILRLMAEGVPGRQAALLSASGAGRTAFSQSLQHLIGLDMVERAPGHGHPLRPEFRLTPLGAKTAALSRSVHDIVPRPEDRALLRRAWTLPVLTVSQQPRYFSQVKSALPRITDRALSQSLKMLEQSRWIQRETRIDLRPPRPTYLAFGLGAELSAAICAKAPG